MLSQEDLDKYEELVNELFDARSVNDDVKTAALQKELLELPRPSIQLYVPLKGDMVLGVDTFAQNAKAEYAKYKNDPNHFVDATAVGTGNPSKYTILRPQTMTLGDAITDEEVELQNKYAYIRTEDRELVSGVESTKTAETTAEAPKSSGRGRGKAAAKATEGFNMPEVKDHDGQDGDGLDR